MSKKKSNWKLTVTRLGWMGLIWLMSVTGLGIVAWLIRLAMNAAGLTSPS